jgi:hypothetical protein
MEYNYFISEMLGYKKMLEDISKLHDMGFDFMEGKFPLLSHTTWMFETAIKSHYGDEGWEWVNWFIYESNWGEIDFSEHTTYRINEDGESEIVDKGENSKYGAFDGDGNPICYSFETLWEYLEKEFNKKPDETSNITD